MDQSSTVKIVDKLTSIVKVYVNPTQVADERHESS